MIDHEQWLALIEFVDIRWAEAEAGIDDVHPGISMRYARALNRMTTALTGSQWYAALEPHQQDYAIVYLHHRFSGLVLNRQLAGNVDYLHGDGPDYAPTEKRTEDRPEEGSAEGKGGQEGKV